MKQLAIAIALSFLTAAASFADQLAKPSERPILTVTGAIENTNDGDKAVFDLTMLEALEGRKTIIATPWHEGVKAFSGPTLAALLEAVGATGRTLHVMALNGYAAVIPIEDAEKFPVILATRIDGEIMSVREKGPSFVIYPFDIAPELYNEQTFGKSVWQVAAIEVR